jgi:hypothetical protein
VSDFRDEEPVSEQARSAETLVLVDGILKGRPDLRHAALEITRRFAPPGTVGELVLDFPGYPLLMAGNLESLRYRLNPILRVGCLPVAREILVFSPETLYVLRCLPELFFFDPEEQNLLDRMVDGFSWVSSRDSGNPGRFVKPLSGSYAVMDSGLLTRGLGMKRPYRSLLSRTCSGHPREDVAAGFLCGGHAVRNSAAEAAIQRMQAEALRQWEAAAVDFLVTMCPMCEEILGSALAGRRPRVVSLLTAMKMAMGE